VNDEAFATSVQSLLRDGRATSTRAALLAGTVSRQLAHASDRFAAGQEDRAMATVTGAFYLLRSGDFRPDMVAGADPVLARASAVVSAQGDEGRALALLTLRVAATSPGSPERADVDAHLSALNGWMRDTQTGGPLEQLGANERIQVSRALLDPSEKAMTAAREATVQWIERAVEYNERQPSARLKREDAFEAFRAFRSGAETLAALYLRQGDAAGALAEIDRSAARRVVPPQLHDALEEASTAGDATGWHDLLGWLLSAGHPGKGEDRDDPELAVDPQLQRAAVWGATVEAYRRDPTARDVDVTLATLLAHFGFPEVAPLVLADAIVPHPDPTGLEGALGIVMQIFAQEEEVEDLASARRVFRSASPLFKLAQAPEMRGTPRNRAIALELAMGTFEARSGNLAEAQPLVQAAVSASPNADGYMTLAAIDRQSDRLPDALTDLSRALGTQEARTSQATAGELHLLAFETYRQAGTVDKARAELLAALGAALSAREQAKAPQDKARAERLLARVLDYYSDQPGAARATDRAFNASGSDKRQVAATVLDTAARAFLRSDATRARTAVNRALQSELRDDDLVYTALWLTLIERQNKTKSDGTAARALASIPTDGRWPGKLASWALGKLKDQDLVAAARTPGQQTEATFYTAMAHRIAGDTSGSDESLRKVAKSPTIDLVEVQLARDLLLQAAGSDSKLFGPPPATVSIP
jgi:tetratricopeptide (TPR) repeat protein